MALYSRAPRRCQRETRAALSCYGLPMESTLKYPVGSSPSTRTSPPKSAPPGSPSSRASPCSVRRAVQGLSKEQLDTPYREGGWSTRQIVHHLADSHMNTLIRLKLCLTENEPTIKPFNQDAWALHRGRAHRGAARLHRHPRRRARAHRDAARLARARRLRADVQASRARPDGRRPHAPALRVARPAPPRAGRRPCVTARTGERQPARDAWRIAPGAAAARLAYLTSREISRNASLPARAVGSARRAAISTG